MFFYIFLFLTALTYSFGQEDWSYHGTNGPAYWPFLFPMDCALRNQSPINIDSSETIYDPNLGSLVFERYDQSLSNYIIENTGTTVELLPTSDEANRPTISGGGLPSRFVLQNIHFHWGSRNDRGSEHTVDGQRGAMECHIVHRNVNYGTMEEALRNKDGLAVLAIVFMPVRESCSNSTIKAIARTLVEIRYAGTETESNVEQPVESLLPSKKMQRFYRYFGSLTTPNCTEAVIWTVFHTAKKIGISELHQFRSVYETEEGEEEVYLVDNFRPVQPLNGRQVYRNWSW